MGKKFFAFSVSLFLGLILISCHNEDIQPVVYAKGTNEEINQWMYEQMKRYYYWNETMPSQGNLSLNPKEYFGKLLHATDRFSYTLQPSKAETYPQSVRGKFGFDLSFVEHHGQVYGVVLYVLSDSPASYSTLKRGMLLTTINGTTLNQANYEGLYQGMINANRAQLQVVQYNGTAFSAPVQVSISQGITLLQPLYQRIFSQKDDKVGYLAIPHFDIGLAQSLLQVFAEFKTQSVNKVVLDLRYNGGGDIASATALSIILAPNIQPNQLFITFKGNNNGGIIPQSFKQALEMNESTLSFETLRNAHPPIQKVYILCGSHTASASEIIINNLKPFMEVVTIGEKTVGKDVAGFAIEDKEIPWVLYPSIYKLFNANDEGGYATGIPPTIAVNELQELQVFPLGDPNEVLLKEALQVMTTTKRMSRKTALKVLSKPNTIKETDPLLQVNLASER